MSVSLFANPSVINMLQDRTLEREIHEALFPQLMYRAEALPERWEANVGERMVMTRSGLMAPSTTPLLPGTDPLPGTYATEQWEIEASQYGSSLDTHMPTSDRALAPIILNDAKTLGQQAGQTLDQLARNKLFVAYQGGTSNLTSAALIGATTINVASINGFTQKLVNGRNLPVSSVNAMAVTFPGTAVVANVVGAAPSNPAQPFGPGVLALSAGLSAALSIRQAISSSTASQIQRVGGGTSVDGITGANVLTLSDVQRAVAYLRGSNVPPKADGLYHLHLSPTAEYQLFQDNAMQRIYQSIPDSVYQRQGLISVQHGVAFYLNNQSPNINNVGALVASGTNALVSPAIGAEVRNNNGVNIDHSILIGGAAFYEKFIDEGAYITDAGITGKIGSFAVVNGGIQVMTDRIRYIMRAPLDRLQQIIGQSWSWSGDFGVPTDALTLGPSGNAAYKRAMVIEHAGA